MNVKIKIYTKSTDSIPAEITREKNPVTADAIIKALPLDLTVNRWGDEVYSDSSQVTVEEENSQIEVEIGDIAYWPPGRAICIFFGKTPASTGDKPAAASGVNVFGKILGEATIFKKTKNGELLRIELE